MRFGNVRCTIWCAVLALVAMQATTSAHVTPVAILRRQADVIRELLSGAVRFTATDVRLDAPQLAALQQQAHYAPNVKSVRFYDGLTADGRGVGTVVFPQIDTQHGPIEVGVGIGPDGAVIGVRVTRATVEMKPWIRDLEQSGLLTQLTGTTAPAGPAHLSADHVSGMGAYAAQVVATATYRALVLRQVLRGS